MYFHVQYVILANFRAKIPFFHRKTHILLGKTSFLAPNLAQAHVFLLLKRFSGSVCWSIFSEHSELERLCTWDAMGPPASRQSSQRPCWTLTPGPRSAVSQLAENMATSTRVMLTTKSTTASVCTANVSARRGSMFLKDEFQRREPVNLHKVMQNWGKILW